MIVSAVKIPIAIPDEELAALLHIVTEPRRQRCARLSNREDVLRSVFAELLLKSVLHRACGVDPREPLEINRNKYGKPFLTRYGDVHFNLSHAGDWVAAAVSEQPIGIDVEKIKDISALSIARRFFSEPEYESLLMLKQPKQRLDRFYAIWTMKESYVKLQGAGLAIPLDSFRVCAAEGGVDGLHQIRDDTGTLAWCRNVPLESGYKLAVCSFEAINPRVHLFDTVSFNKQWTALAML